MSEYSEPVTRTEHFHVTKAQLEKERRFQIGKRHRKQGLPCMSANGAYLDGWYNPEKDFYFITEHAAHLL